MISGGDAVEHMGLAAVLWWTRTRPKTGVRPTLGKKQPAILTGTLSVTHPPFRLALGSVQVIPPRLEHG